MKKSSIILTFLWVCWGAISTAQAQGMEAFLGEVKIFTGDIVPQDWALCHGQSLSIEKNQALFAVLGTTFGGDGRTTFALPDLRGRMVAGAGATQENYSFALAEMRGGTPEEVRTEKGNASEQPITIQPFIAVNYIICIKGIFPQRD